MKLTELPNLSEHELWVRIKHRRRQVNRLKKEIETLEVWARDKAVKRLQAQPWSSVVRENRTTD